MARTCSTYIIDRHLSVLDLCTAINNNQCDRQTYAVGWGRALQDSEAPNLQPRGRCVDPALQTKVVTFSFYSDRGCRWGRRRDGWREHWSSGAAQIYVHVVGSGPTAHADVSSVADVSEVRNVSVFRVNVSRVNECSPTALRKRELSKDEISASHNSPY
jgi:hypothetical protein